MRASFFICLTALSLLACKPVKVDIPGDQDLTATDAADSPTENWGTIDIDDNGRPHLKLMLSLDRVAGKNFSGALPKCMAPLDKQFKLGEIRCSQGAKVSKPLLAGHVNQTCYTQPADLGAPSSLKLLLSGCSRAEISGFRFTPPIKIDLEQ